MATAEKTTITYNGSTLATLEAGQTATIKAAEYEFDHDLVFKAGSGGGGGGGGSAEFNIAYGDTAPSDTSKLWVKANEPEAVSITSSIVTASEELEGGVSALPTAAGGYAAAAVGTKVYLFGGSSSSTKINVFNTETNTIETLSTQLPSIARYPTAAAVGTRVYVFGGSKGSTTSDYLNTINVFDTETNTIETLSATLPSAAMGIASAVIGTKIYLCGGKGTGSYSNAYRNTISVFNAEHNTISTIAELPSKQGYIAAAAVGAKLYLFGGYGSSTLNTINVFDTETNTLETLSTKLPKAAYSIAAAAVGTKVYLFGGYTGNGSDASINVFDTETNTIEALDTAQLPAKLNAVASAVIGTRVYLFGGKSDSETGYNGATAAIHMFEASMPLATNNMLIEASATKNRFNLLPNVELGVNNVYLGNANGKAERVKAHFHRVTSGVDYEYFYTSSATEVSSGTELTSSIKCHIGDLVVAAIATRDTLTVSDGWNLVSTSGINSTDSYGQRLSWAWKFAESTTESITVTQASAQRLYINMVALRGATSVVDNGYSYRDDTTSSALTVNKPSGLVLWGMTTPTWSTTVPYSGWATSNDMPIIQLGTDTQPRLGIGLDQSNDESVTLISGSNATTIIVGSLTVQGMDKFYTATPFTRAEWVEI